MSPFGDDNLISLGTHCSVENCQQLDFLPFKCDCCSKIFCLEHRTYASHKCPNSGDKELSIFVCPVCAKGVRIPPGHDVNITFENHSVSDCDPKNYARVHHKPRCQATNCREKLTTINSYTCKRCNQRVCLKHRFSEDHDCEMAIARMKQTRSDRFFSIFSSKTSPKPELPKSQSSSPLPTPPPSPFTPSTSVSVGTTPAASVKPPTNSQSSPLQRPNSHLSTRDSSQPKPVVASPFGPIGASSAPSPSSTGNPTGHATTGTPVRESAAARAAAAAEARAVSTSSRATAAAVPPTASRFVADTNARSLSKAETNNHVITPFGTSVTINNSNNNDYFTNISAKTITTNNAKDYSISASQSDRASGSQYFSTPNDIFQCHLCAFHTLDPIALMTHVEVCSALRGVSGSGSNIGNSTQNATAVLASGSGSTSSSSRRAPSQHRADKGNSHSRTDSNCSVM